MSVSLKWNDYNSNVSKSFTAFRNVDYLHDVTFVTDDHQHHSAHKLVLSASSEFFKNIFEKSSKHLQLLICLDGLTSHDLSIILDFIYNGEVKIKQDNVERFLANAQRLKLNGITVDEVVTSTKVEEVKVEPALFNYEANAQEDFCFEDGEMINLQEEDTKENKVVTKDTIEKRHIATKSKETKKEKKVFKETGIGTADGKIKTDSKIGSTDKERINYQNMLCRVCGETSFKNEVKYRVHMQHHKSYDCSSCGYKTYNKEVLKEHERTHSGEKPLVCTWCARGFRQKKTLQNHERLHTGEKPYKCKYCDRKFAQRTSLNVHIQSHHKDVLKNQTAQTQQKPCLENDSVKSKSEADTKKLNNKMQIILEDSMKESFTFKEKEKIGESSE